MNFTVYLVSLGHIREVSSVSTVYFFRNSAVKAACKLLSSDFYKVAEDFWENPKGMAVEIKTLKISF